MVIPDIIIKALFTDEIFSNINVKSRFEAFQNKLKNIKGKIKYSHELAFSHELKKDAFELIEVSYEDAIRFLQKKVLSEVPNIKSWGLIAFQNQPLGWVKKVGGRLNNYYPKEFRIRKEF